MSMNMTRGELVRAKIINLSTNDSVACMFNPHEYTLSKSNSWTSSPTNGQNTPGANFVQGGAQTLKLTLHFDTFSDASDVRDHTDPLWRMMMVEDDDTSDEIRKGVPTEVAFEWGKLYFKAVITSLSQKFTLFTPDGTPVRCTVDITLEQKVDIEDDYKDNYSPAALTQNTAQEVTAVQGERVDNIMAQETGKVDKMREFMEANNIDNPLRIAPGSRMRL